MTALGEAMTKTDAAEYIASLSDELAAIAHSNDLAHTTYLLQMAAASARQEGDPKAVRPVKVGAAS